jgi:shikimate dehydrogenase
MPYKEAVIPLLDRMDPSARAIDSVNTIVNDDGVLTGYNTDYIAIVRLLADHRVPASHSVLLQGSGGMAKAVAAALRGAGFRTVTIVARNEETGRALADLYGFGWQSEVGSSTADLIVNVTPLGMAGADEASQSFADATVAAAQEVFDVVALPSETPLIKAARAAGKPVITGAEVIAIQAEEQFVLYTGVRPTPEQVRAASEFSRA